jgi:hypothetical protein
LSHNVNNSAAELQVQAHDVNSSLPTNKQTNVKCNQDSCFFFSILRNLIPLWTASKLRASRSSFCCETCFDSQFPMWMCVCTATTFHMSLPKRQILEVPLILMKFAC